MATRIKETPILTGKDAETFLLEIQKPKKASKKERERIRQSFERIESISKIKR